MLSLRVIIFITKTSDQIEISLFNIEGKQIMTKMIMTEKMISKSLILDISDIPKGMYLLKFFSKETKDIVIQKIVIN